MEVFYFSRAAVFNASPSDFLQSYHIRLNIAAVEHDIKIYNYFNFFNHLPEKKTFSLTVPILYFSNCDCKNVCAHAMKTFSLHIKNKFKPQGNWGGHPERFGQGTCHRAHHPVNLPDHDAYSAPPYPALSVGRVSSSQINLWLSRGRPPCPVSWRSSRGGTSLRNALNKATTEADSESKPATAFHPTS